MDAPTGHDQNADQIAYWNGPAGQRWAQRQAAQGGAAAAPVRVLRLEPPGDLGRDLRLIRLSVWIPEVLG